MGVPVDVLRVETDELEQLLHPLAPAALRNDLAVDLKWLADDVPDRHARVQRGVGILKNDLNIPSEPAHIPARLGVDVHLVEGELAARRLLQPHEHPAKS
jgi:hypothetical protein